MQKHMTTKKIISLLTLFLFIGFMATTAGAGYSDRGTPMLMAAYQDEPQAEEDNEPSAEESDAPFTEEEGLQDDSSESDEELNLENLTDEELQLYQEMRNHSGN